MVKKIERLNVLRVYTLSAIAKFYGLAVSASKARLCEELQDYFNTTELEKMTKFSKCRFNGCRLELYALGEVYKEFTNIVYFNVRFNGYKYDTFSQIDVMGFNQEPEFEKQTKEYTFLDMKTLKRKSRENISVVCECKDHYQQININEVVKFIDSIRDLRLIRAVKKGNVHALLFTSESGLSVGGEALADKYGIEIIVVDEWKLKTI